MYQLSRVLPAVPTHIFPYFGFIFSLSFFEALNVILFLGASIMSSPVAGFLSRLSAFCLAMNFPKPEIITSPPI